MSSDTTLQTTEAGVDTDIRQRDIVVGVDGSDESFAALRWALQEASLTGQRVNAVYGWTHSWDMGSEPDSEEQWAAMRHGIAKRLRDWVAQASSGMAINEDRVKLTSVRASGTVGNRQGRATNRSGPPVARSRGPMVFGLIVGIAGRGGEGSGHRGAHSR